jgi:double-stranded RNA-specific adenosine deaminase
MRAAEKDRQSTCRFADRVATAVIGSYQRHVPVSIRDAYSQTVLAGVVVALPAPTEQQPEAVELVVASFGVGTKFLPCAQVSASRSAAPTTPPSERGSTRVLDCHAEVLARRGFQRFLLAEMELAQLPQSQAGEGSRILERASSPLRRSGSAEGELPRFRLRLGLTFHFYTR